MRVTPANVADIGVVTGLWVELAADQRVHGSHLVAEANREAVREAIARAIVAGEVFVARVNEEIVGFVMVSIEVGRYEQDVHRGTVDNIFVQPDDRGCGIGALLLGTAERRLAAAGVDVVSLETMADNDAARRFYEGHDYESHRVELEKPIDANAVESEDDSPDGVVVDEPLPARDDSDDQTDDADSNNVASDDGG
ncbi:MAG: acetyltransferase, GNAT family [uncultured archaeon A07HR60]|jgi:Acetyltransferases|nr:MAG: acetyltransferase, GNAT family [uncultured archaeon A07HR60]